MKLKKGRFLLKWKIAKYINKTNIDSRFKPLIISVIMRRAIQYNRSHEELMNDINAVALNLKQIRIVDQADMADYNYALAIYSNYDKEILISSVIFREDPEDVFHLFAHELHHVMLKNKDGEDILEKYNLILETRGSVYQELLAERASYRLVSPAKNNLTTYNHNAYAYEDIVFVLDFIEAAYGVNEQELLEHMLNGRKEMEVFLSQKIGESVEKTEIFLDELEVGASVLMKALYGPTYADLKQEDAESKDNFQKDIIAAIDSMFDICQSKIDERLENADVDTIAQAQKLNDEIAFSQYRLDNILRNRLNNFKGDLGDKIESVWKNCMNKYAKKTMVRISDMEQMLQDTNLSTDQLKVCLFNEVRMYCHDDDEFEKRFMTKRKKKESFTISAAFVESKKESPEYVQAWDNRRIINIIEGIFKSERTINARYGNLRRLPAYDAQRGSNNRNSLNKYVLTSAQKDNYYGELGMLKEKQNEDGNCSKSITSQDDTNRAD